MAPHRVLGSYVSTRARAQMLGGLLVSTALVSWIAVGFDLADLRLLGREAAGQALEPGRKGAYRATGALIHTAQWLLLVLTGVLFVEWLYQARANLRAFGARRLRYSRGWALAAFAVPVLNLVRPYGVVREIWQASDPRARDPFAWSQRPTSQLLPLWWASFVGWALLASLALVMTLGAGYDASKLQLARGVWMAADALAAIGVSLAYFVVEHISEAQEEKWGHASRSQAPSLTPALEAH